MEREQHVVGEIQHGLKMRAGNKNKITGGNQQCSREHRKDRESKSPHRRMLYCLSFSRHVVPVVAVIQSSVGEWLSLVEHLVRDQGVGGSNPLSPTNLFTINYLQAQEIRFRRLFHWLQDSISKSYAVSNQ